MWLDHPAPLNLIHPLQFNPLVPFASSINPAFLSLEKRQGRLTESTSTPVWFLFPPESYFTWYFWLNVGHISVYNEGSVDRLGIKHISVIWRYWWRLLTPSESWEYSSVLKSPPPVTGLDAVLLPSRFLGCRPTFTGCFCFWLVWFLQEWVCKRWAWSCLCLQRSRR